MASTATKALTTVLVVDRIIATRVRLCSFLSEMPGVRALGCGWDWEHICRYVAEVQPRCLVVDVPTDGPQGFRLLRSVRAIAPSCCVVVLTSDFTEEFRRHSREEGVDYFLSKASDFERLPDIVRGLQETA